MFQNLSKVDLFYFVSFVFTLGFLYFSLVTV
ncbi:hypothetical protein JOC48_002623 [Aquibacillus albus]|uniref:Uncharacterized protein n=1 Tax=Aquibacillus albus TaxID=1168171 RepID=A0ABS2N1W4_9BACI|nr:hypothetical protein [Aquibacillus albus]